MTSLTIKYKNPITKKLFDLARSSLQKSSEETLQILCKAYLSNPLEVTLYAENYRGLVKVEENSYLTFR